MLLRRHYSVAAVAAVATTWAAQCHLVMSHSRLLAGATSKALANFDTATHVLPRGSLVILGAIRRTAYMPAHFGAFVLAGRPGRRMWRGHNGMAISHGAQAWGWSR